MYAPIPMTPSSPCQTGGPEPPFEIFPLFSGNCEGGVGVSASGTTQSSPLAFSAVSPQGWSPPNRPFTKPPTAGSTKTVPPTLCHSLSFGCWGQCPESQKVFRKTLPVDHGPYHLCGENANLVPRRVEDKGLNIPSRSSLFCLGDTLHTPGPSLQPRHIHTAKEPFSVMISDPHPVRPDTRRHVCTQARARARTHAQEN